MASALKPSMVSADSHVVEPGNLWTDRMEKKHAARAPHIETSDTGDWWWCDGMRLSSVIAGTQTGKRFKNPEQLKTVSTMEMVRRGGYIPSVKIKDMDSDGVYGEIVYPTAGLFQFQLPDSALFTAATRAYNGWIAEFCQEYPKRLQGVSVINIDNVAQGVKELRRARTLGLGGAMIPVSQGEEHPYSLPAYDPFWAAAEELQMPISIHAGTNRQHFGASKEKVTMVPRFSAAYTTTVSHWAQVAVCQMIFSGVFERFPKLQLVVVEFETGWAPHLLRMMDWNYTQRARTDMVKLAGGMLPSDHFHRNVAVSFQEDPIGMQMRHLIGVDNLLWGDDYPHTESTFPQSQAILDRIMKDVPAAERRKMTRTNAAKLYGFDVPAAASKN